MFSANRAEVSSAALYEAPAVEILGSAANEILWAGVVALTAVGVIAALAALCQFQGGNLSWGISWGGPFGLIPSGYWYQCIQH